METIVVPDQPSVRSTGRSSLAVALVFWAFWAAMAGGCASLDLSEQVAAIKGDETQILPARTVAVWSDTVLHQPNSPGVRGFGGRIMFYSDKNDEPVKIDGSLVVYAWDDTDETKSRKIPDRKYVYTADQLQQHYSLSKLGHSYSVWIPWESADGPQKRITLIARFLGRNGGEVTSKSSQVLLPGATVEPYEEPDDAFVRAKQRLRRRDLQAAPREHRSDIIQVDYAREVAPQDIRGDDTAGTWPAPKSEQPEQPANSLKTSTIDVSPGFARRNFGQFEEPVDLDSIDMQTDKLKNPTGVRPIEIGPSSTILPAPLDVHPPRTVEQHSSVTKTSARPHQNRKPPTTGRPAANWSIPAPTPSGPSPARTSTGIRGAFTGHPRSGAVTEPVWRQAPHGQPGSLVTRLSLSPLRAQTRASTLRGSDPAHSPHSRGEWPSRYSRTPRSPATTTPAERPEFSGSEL